MNKTKTTLAAVGGVMLVAVAGAGYFAWSAYSGKTAALVGDDEGTVGLETVQAMAERLSVKPVYPCAESIEKLTASRDTVTDWKNSAFEFVARGDRRIAPTTAAAFKEFLQSDAQRLRALPAGSEKKTLDESFDFGPFKTYISDATMPEQAQLTDLQRKWDDLVTIVETLSASGVERMTAIDVKAVAKEADEDPKPTTKKGKKKPVKKEVETGIRPLINTYVVTCQMHAPALVDTINALASNTRFMVVTDFTVRHEKDTLGEALGAKKEEAATPTSGRRRRRSGAAAAVVETEKKEEDAPRVTVVTDPAEDPAFESKLTVAVYDFRSVETPAEKQEEEEK